jgi:hypothetical protein
MKIDNVFLNIPTSSYKRKLRIDVITEDAVGLDPERKNNNQNSAFDKKQNKDSVSEYDEQVAQSDKSDSQIANSHIDIVA